MKTLTPSKLLGWLPVIAILWGVSFSAHALGTASSTSITNRATINYDVGTTAQTPIESSPGGNTTPGVGNGTDTAFVVDNRVDLVLTEVGATYTTGAPGEAGLVTTFSLTNEGNTIQDYSFAAVNNVGGTLFTILDDSDVTITGIFVEDGVNAGYQVAEDTAIFVDELLADGTATVYVIATIPAASVDTNYAIVDLTATTYDGGAAGLGGLTTATAGADTAAVDVVLADGYDDLVLGGLDGDTSDGVNDGAFTAQDAYLVASALITVTKTSAVISDPINGNGGNQKRIPGAVVRYTVVVTNTGGSAAANVTLVDSIPANTTYAPVTITLGGVAQTDIADADASDFNVTNANAVTSVIGALLAAGAQTVTFDVTVN